jgi:hypothetical protein
MRKLSTTSVVALTFARNVPPVPALGHLLSMVTADDESVGLMRDGTGVRVGVLGVVAGYVLTDSESPMQ